MIDAMERYESSRSFQLRYKTWVQSSCRLRVRKFVQTVERSGDVNHVVERLVQQDETSKDSSGQQVRVRSGGIVAEVVPLPDRPHAQATATRPSVV